LVEFPLSEKLLQKHIYYLLKNIDYSEAPGRKIVIEAFEKIIIHFPEEIVNYYVKTTKKFYIFTYFLKYYYYLQIEWDNVLFFYFQAHSRRKRRHCQRSLQFVTQTYFKNQPGFFYNFFFKKIISKKIF